jgi:pimeloyl-ACP methyl ester carboxylesterase
MATMVIIHGGWGGGWEWTPVARQLRQHGHDVFTPTLTGLGEREHLGAYITLSDHIKDVEAVFTYEDLREVILCGHSYSGMVVTGAADRVPKRIRGLVYFDAFVPTNGQALRDTVPEEFFDFLLSTAKERGDGKIPFPAEQFLPEGSLPEELRMRYINRTRPHPVATMTEPVRLSGAVDRLPRAYVRCTGEDDPEADFTATFAARARVEGWRYRESATPHDLQLFNPEGTAAIAHDLAMSFD